VRLHAGGGASSALLDEAIAAFQEQGEEIELELQRGMAIAEAAARISSDTADEYRHLEEMLLGLRREYEEFEAKAGALIGAIRTDGRPDVRALVEDVERAAGTTRRQAEGLLLELESFMEETGWQVEAHGDKAVRTIGLVALAGAIVVVIFGAFVLFSIFSHMEKRRRVEEALRSSEVRHQADLSALQDSAAELATLASELEIRRRLEERLTAALDLERAEIRLDADGEGNGGEREVLSFRGEPLGTILCGPKRSGEPLSPQERRLLRSVAQQGAVALHNARTIQALREANESLLRNARLVAVGEFAGAVAHGIRNPLSVIRAAAQAAHRKSQPGPSADTLKTIMAEADRLDHRIGSLLYFSRPHELSLRKVDLRDVLRSVSRTVSSLPERAGTRIVTELPPDPVDWEVDPDYLEDALVELSVNALRAIPSGGELRLHVEPQGRGVAITVADTGPGIPEGARARVFDLFFTTRPDGTGMGLATVKKIVEAHGGALGLERTGPEGTVFRIEFARAGEWSPVSRDRTSSRGSETRSA
jgi:signal transduction histidine kinase